MYSEDTIVSTNDCVYSSSCHVENKHFENVNATEENTKTDKVIESYEDFVANLPLPVAEFNKSVRNKIEVLNLLQYIELLNSIWSKLSNYVSEHVKNCSYI